MSPISRIELQGQITRAQDYTTIKHNENNKGMVDQSNFQNQFHKEIDNRMNQVHKGEDTTNENKKYDAKEKGNGQYSENKDKNRKKESEDGKDIDGKVMIKNVNRFDMKI